MFWLINKICIGLLTGLVNGCNQTKYVSLSNQKCQIKFNLLSLIYTLMNTELHYYPFKVKLDVLEVLILVMTYLIKYVFQTKQKI